jgi:hypothetical protein
VPIWLSLVVIFGAIVVTALASLLKMRRDTRRGTAAPGVPPPPPSP